MEQTKQNAQSVRAAIYCRVAEPNAARIQRQETECRALAASRGWEVAEVYVDDGVSASSKRPAYQRMLADMEAGKVEAIVAHDWARLSRRPADLQRLLEHSVEIATVGSGPLDLNTADGRMYAAVLAHIDQAEADRHSERIRAALKAKRLQEGS
jgi:site-specific DNA recombinase